jgi:N-acyl-D-aspartate/D-glutamate deacylase
VADLEELRALLRPVRDAGRGVVALLPGGVIADEDVLELQRQVRRPFTWTALLTIAGYPAFHRGRVEANDAARADGVEIWPQISCRPLVLQINLADPFTLNLRPSFAGLMEKSRAERVAAYRDPAWRASALQDLEGGGGRLPFNWQSLSVAECEGRPELVGRPVTELAEEWGCTPLDVMLDISLADDLRTRFRSVLANDDPDGIAWLLPRDNVLLGLADSGAHVSQLCDACFATDLLGHWVRDQSVMSLERAIHKLSGEPAAVYGLSDRGTLEVGKAADICVFDPATVAAGPMRRKRDFPADGERLTVEEPEGMNHVLVNGVPIRVDGASVEAGSESRPGVVLRH